jgi:hypothetical protein
MPAYLFNVGQTVQLEGGLRGPIRPAYLYYITGKLPPFGDSLQYRIHNDDERYERVTTQDSLEPVGTSQLGSTTLIERTFGHGQGTKEKQSRDQKAQAGKGSSKA